MPMKWLRDMQLFWTEQYLLMALLLDNPRAKVIYAGAYHLAYHRSRLDRFMGGRAATKGASFWFEYSGRPSGSRRDIGPA
jgi:hypothetical protein